MLQLKNLNLRKENDMKKMILERVNKNKCPICIKELNKDITFVDYNGTKQPVHTIHIKFKKETK